MIHFCPEVPQLLVGTKLDLRNDDAVLEKLKGQGLSPISTEQGHELAKKIKAVKYLECSAKTSQNLKMVFDEAVKGCLRIQPHNTSEMFHPQRERERECVCVCVCVCARARVLCFGIWPAGIDPHFMDTFYLSHMLSVLFVCIASKNSCLSYLAVLFAPKRKKRCIMM